MSRDDQPTDAPPQIGRFAIDMLKRIKLPWLALPPCILGLCYFYVSTLSAEQLRRDREMFELVAVVILWTAVGIGLLRVGMQWRSKQPYLIWQTVFVTTLLFREYHLLKSSTTIAYLTLATLAVLAWLKYLRLRDYMSTRFVVTVLTLTCLCYVISQTLDTDRFKYAEQYAAINSNVEEMMEVAGHCCALVLVLFARPARDPSSQDHV